MHRKHASDDDAAATIRHLRAGAIPLRDARDLDPLVERLARSRYVLLGEATHGTAEFYSWRSTLTRRLIERHGFSLLAVEGDWPDCYRVNRYVRGFADSGRTAHEVLHAFDRWPTWMWANEETVELVDWLRSYNELRPPERKVGFYGLDVYSLWESLHSVLLYLDRRDPQSAALARRAFRCFEPYGEDAQQYARATSWVPVGCQDEVIELLAHLRSATRQFDGDGREAAFNAEQNALVAKNAESYYRTLVQGGESWNVRDRHMTETLERLVQHHGPDAKIIVWEHNTHVGDARATDMARRGLVNVGQLVRQAHPRPEVAIVGFATQRGSVIASREWGAPLERMEVPPARQGSWESLLHQASPSDQLLLLAGESDSPLSAERGLRAIGVVYHPARERFGNYVPTVLTERFDALVYLDFTKALHPLHVPTHPTGELPETFPTAV